MGTEPRDAPGSESRTEPEGEPPRGDGVDRLRALGGNPLLRFVVLFVFYLSASSVAYPVLRDRFGFALDALMRATARLEYYIFRVFTTDVSSNETLVVFQGTSVRIIEECTGLYEAIIFSAAVLAFPTSWKKRFIGLLLGGPLIYAFNALRITTLITALRFYPAAFDFMHLYFWQATLILMIMSVWALWFFKVVLREEKSRPSHP